jgi:hypothetical protein
MVEHVDRRIGKLLRHSKAADKFSVGHEQASARRARNELWSASCGLAGSRPFPLHKRKPGAEAPRPCLSPPQPSGVGHQPSPGGVSTRTSAAVRISWLMGSYRRRSPRRSARSRRRSSRRQRRENHDGTIPRWEHCSFECHSGAHWFGLSQPCPVADEAARGVTTCQ